MFQCKVCLEKDKQIEELKTRIKNGYEKVKKHIDKNNIWLDNEVKKLEEKHHRDINELKIEKKDLLDRLMAFNENAFVYYKAETKSGKPLFPHGTDAKGKPINYEGTDPTETNEEILRSMGEDIITVEEPAKEPTKA